MKQLPERLRAYFMEAVGLDLELEKWAKARSVPFYLTAAFHFLTGKIMGHECLFVICPDDIGAADVYKHEKQLSKYAGVNKVYVIGSLTHYMRSQLVKMRLSFVVPGTQMYLPNMLMDLRENTLSGAKQPVSELLSPSAQATAIMLLYLDDVVVSTSYLSEEFGYSKMTASRVVNELTAFEFIQKHSAGKNNGLKLLGPKSSAWHGLKDKFRSPLREKFYVEGKPQDWSFKGEVCLAGETALASYSMLGEPAVPEYALDRESWKVFVFNNRERVHSSPDYFIVNDLPYCEIQVWSYRPDMCENGVADRLSLYLTLAGHDDERVSMSIDEMMECLNWFMD